MCPVPCSGVDDRAFIYLASASPRRKALLEQLGLALELVPAGVDESLHPGEAALAYTRRLARAKATTGWRHVEAATETRHPVLGADTTVVCEGQIMGKPESEASCLEMLMCLSGRWHRVVTAVALRYNDDCVVTASSTRVKFRALTVEEAVGYWRTGEPADKAGAYAIQGLGGRFVERIEGSYTGVVGLPLVETEALLQQFSIKCGWWAAT
jgi:septum formation protein